MKYFRVNGKKSDVVAGCLIALAFMAVGCSADAGGGGAESEQIAAVDNELVAATWLNPPGSGVVTGLSGGRGPLPVCYANKANDGISQQPGKVWKGFCEFGWGGKSYYNNNYKVLQDGGYSWVNPGHYDANGYWTIALPSNAIDGGDAGAAANHVRLGICIAYNDGDMTWHPGKFYANKCNYARGGSATPGVNGEQTGDGKGVEVAVEPANSNFSVKVLVR